MDLPNRNTLNEFINLQLNKQQRQQRQQHLLRSVSRKRKFEIPKEELKDEDFDQIVVETSRLVTMNMRMQQQLGRNNTAQNDSGLAPRGEVFNSHDTARQSDERSPESEWANQANEPVFINGAGDGAHNRLNLNQPKRPMNAFMVWGQAIRRELHNKFSNVQNAVLSKALGRVWKRLELSEKEPYITRANIIKSNHKRDYPNYRYQPRRIQRRLQQTSHHISECDQLKRQPQQQQQRTSSVLKRSIKLVNVITSAARMLSQENVVAEQVSSLTPVQVDESVQATMKTAPLNNQDGDLWKPKVLHTGGSGESDDASGSVLEYGGGFSTKKFPHDQEAKYYRFESHNPQLGSEYHLPSIEFDQSASQSCDKQTTHTIESLNHQVPLDDNHNHHHHHGHHNEQHQPRLFYYNSAENLKRTSVQMMSQPVAGNLCIDLQHQQQHSDQNTISIDNYNSADYRQQFQQQQEEEEITEQHQRQLAQQLDIDDFSQYQQAENGHLQYYDADCRYEQHNHGPHHHHHHHLHHNQTQQQQQHLPFIRQMNEFAQTVDQGTYCVHTQTEHYYNHRAYSDEICPV